MNMRIEKDTVLLLKPNFIICIFEEKLSKSECEVVCLGKKIQARIEDLVRVKLPIYRKP